MHPLRRNTFGLAAGLALAAVLGTAWWTWPRPMPLETVRVARGDVSATLVDLGETRVREPYAITAPASGQLRRLALEPGDAVAEGQVLAWIDPARSAPIDARSRAGLEAGLRQARAAARGARAEAGRAEEEARRSAVLRERRLVAAQADRDVQARAQAARAALDEADAAVARLEAELDDPQRSGTAIPVRAPAAGVVLARHAESARPVAAGEPLLEIGDPGDLEVVAEFLSQDAALIKPGARAWIEGWGGPAAPATVRRISPGGRRKVSALGVEEQRVDVWLDPDPPLRGIGHGYQVEARIETALARGVLRVPVESLLRDGERWIAWRVVDGRLSATPVTLGLSDGRWREVTAGLDEGDVIARRPGAGFDDGAAVESRP